MSRTKLKKELIAESLSEGLSPKEAYDRARTEIKKNYKSVWQLIREAVKAAKEEENEVLHMEGETVLPTSETVSEEG